MSCTEETHVERTRSFRSYSPVRLSDLYVRRAQLDQAIHALERVQRMQERRARRLADYGSILCDAKPFSAEREVE